MRVRSVHAGQTVCSEEKLQQISVERSITVKQYPYFCHSDGAIAYLAIGINMIIMR